MNKEDPYRQKADHTRQRINRPKPVGDRASGISLPPRSELHQKTKKKEPKKASFPLIRVLVVFFILLPVTVFAVYTYRDVLFPEKSKPVIAENGGYETISIEDSDTEKKSINREGDDKNTSDKKQELTDETLTDDESALSEEAVPVEGNTNPAPQTEVAAAVEGTQKPQPENSTSENAKTPNVMIKEHTVQTGENLYRIALKYYQSNYKSGMDIIKKANNLQSDTVRVGQVLKIPIQN
jgi:LysM repeat protein